MSKKVKEVIDGLIGKQNVLGGSLRPKLKITKGEEEQEDSIRIYVQKKESLSALEAKDVIPETVIVDGKEYPTDVFNIGELKAMDDIIDPPPDPKARYRPLMMGISAMNIRSGGACTLGGFAIDNKTDEVVMLSNQHCFGMENDAVKGDAVVQPSRLDNNVLAYNRIGKFVRGVNLKFTDYECGVRDTATKIDRSLFAKPTQDLVNKVDVSCASIDDGIDYVLKAPNNREINKVGDPTDEYARAWAYGRTSSYSYNGLYIDFDGYVKVGYRRGTIGITDVVIGYQSETFKCIPGDSGSFWAEDDKLCGLMFAGSTYTWIGCKWSNIAKELDVRWF